jgi:hypothetical protein
MLIDISFKFSNTVVLTTYLIRQVYFIVSHTTILTRYNKLTTSFQ